MVVKRYIYTKNTILINYRDNNYSYNDPNNFMRNIPF